jgi:hypothetical protein
MLCLECIKLAILQTTRICIRCQGTILNNLSCICDNCSNDQKVCSICLKKISIGTSGQNKKVLKPGCRSCGR